ncbi:DNA-directed RNA polymerase IIIsubunit Rpc31fungi [Penicillium sp. IBT 31633x]|nr:DNA-directed RNA polymerase IIIsubunit Rpc31fungi [Penicillium sp. IBT 31633x]
MSRRGAPKGKKPPGTEFTWDADPGGEPDTAPTPLYPKYTVPFARKLSPTEQTQVDYYRGLRESFHDGPYYSVLDASSSNAKKGSAARANFDPFHGMPTYSGRYQKKRRTLPKITGRSYVLKFFPRELWQTLQPNFRPDASLDGYQAQTSAAGLKRGFEDEEDEAGPVKRTATGEEEEEEGEAEVDENALLDEEDEQEEEMMDDDFSEDDDEMGGDYNAEQYFDDGEDDMGDEDGGGGGGDDDF